MSIYVDNLSALRFLCQIERSLDESTTVCRRLVTSDATASLRKIEHARLDRFGIQTRPLHVHLSDQAKRSSSSRVIAHVRTVEMPPNSWRKLDEGVYVASPELCFFEMASVLTLPKLIEFGFFLCGTYTLNPFASKKNDREPLSTKRKLASFAKRMGGYRGVAAAREALRYVIEGSASPRETKLAMILSLPVRMGGFGLPPPTLNLRIDFSPKESALFGQKFVIVDLCWEKVGLEYDGENNHTCGLDLARDRQKNSNLKYRGIDIMRVDKYQIGDVYRAGVLARKVCKALGMRWRKPTGKEWRRKAELFDVLGL